MTDFMVSWNGFVIVKAESQDAAILQVRNNPELIGEVSGEFQAEERA